MARSSLAKHCLAVAALVSVAVGVGSCDAGRGGPGVETRVSAVDGEFTVDVTQPIGQRWQRIGGVAVLGNPSSAVQDVSGNVAAKYQTFANGVIVWTNDYGAVRLPRPIFDKWVALDAQAIADVGVPTGDFTFADATTQTVGFVFGRMFFYTTVPDVVLVQWKIYQRFLLAHVGFPLSDEVTIGSGRVQSFQFGEIYWNGDGNVDAFAVNAAGPIRNRYADLGGPLGALGFPTSNVEIIYGDEKKAVVLGKSCRFERGTIYLNNATSAAWELMRRFEVVDGVEVERDSILDRYEEFGGPRGWLGFPITGQQTRATSGVTFNDFEHGVVAEQAGLVYHFGDLEVHFKSIHGDKRDGIFGTSGHVDIFANISIVENGFTVSQRFPASGDYGHSGHDFDSDDHPLNSPLGEANSALTAFVQVELWDADTAVFGIDNPPDRLGTLSQDYSIDNLWGATLGNEHHSDHADAVFNVESTHTFDARDFRGQLWWSFLNFATPLLSWEQFDATFADANADATLAFLHPFNVLFYTQWYAKIADGGNCFGMSLESIFAQVNHSAWAEPIHDYFPDTQNGERLTAANDKHASLMNDLNIKHGYQLGASTAHWFLALWRLGLTRDPKAVFEGARVAFVARDFPLISLIESGVNSGRKHTVRPFKFEKRDEPCISIPSTIASSKCWVIHVVDPDLPVLSQYPEGATIQIDPETNSFYFADSAQKHKFIGDSESGSRMFFEPFNLYTGPQVTFFSLGEPTSNHYFLVDDNGSLSQLTDDDGRTLYDDDATGTFTVLDPREADDPNRIPEVAPLPTSAGPGTTSIEVYAARPAAGATYHYDLASVPGVAAGTPVEATFQSRLFSSHFSIPATPGKPDRISAIAMGTGDKAMALTIASDSEPKTVIWTIAGPDKQNWKEHTIPMEPGQTVTLRWLDGGNSVGYDNGGPDTTIQVRIHNAAGTPPIDLGPVTLPHGTSTTQFSLPVTTLSLSDEVNGNAGWLTAPPTVTLTARDQSGTGISAIEYGPDGVNWTPYTGPFPYTTEGESTLYYRARDNANNLELPKTHGFKLDTRMPTATGSVSTTAGVTLTYVVTDPAPGSGVAGLHVAQQGATASFLTAASGTVSLPGSCSAVALWGEDVAGNLTAPQVTIADTVPPVFTTAPPATITTTLCTVAAGLNLGTPAASDDCGSVTITNDAPAKFPLGTTIVTWTARDGTGNTATRTTTVATDLGDDVSCCPTGTTIIRGTSTADVLNGTSGADCILGLGGQDVIRGNGGNDALSGGNGDDVLWGGDGNDWLSGGTGQDNLRGENGNDTLSGGAGDDVCFGGNNDDKLMGGAGQDTLMGEAGNDNLSGDAGFDTLDGGPGNDVLRGGTEQDTLIGGGGTDQCVQDGSDVLAGTCTAVAP